MERIAILNLQGVFQQDAEKEIFDAQPPEGESNLEELTASLKRCPDTNPALYETRLY